MKACDRCGKSPNFTLRYVIAVIYADDETTLDGQHAESHELTLCPGCCGLTMMELQDAVRRIREGCDA